MTDSSTPLEPTLLDELDHLVMSWREDATWLRSDRGRVVGEDRWGRATALDIAAQALAAVIERVPRG